MSTADLDIEDIYPLSPLQQGLLFHSLYAPESGVYVVQVVCTMRGAMDVASFGRAWQRVVDRHPILRTAFVWDDIDEPLQVVYRRAQIPLAQHDYRGLAPAEQERRQAAFLEMDRRSGFAIDTVPLMRLTLIRTADDIYTFIWSYHHAVLDGWSLSLLLREVFALYDAFQRGVVADLASPRPYRDYIAWLQEQDLSRAEVFWRGRLGDVDAATILPSRRTTRPAAPGDAAYAEQLCHLPAATTAALQTLARQHRLTLNTVVQGAWALLLSHYSRSVDVLFGISAASRPVELAGADAMIGLLINTVPMRVRVAPNLALLEWLHQLQQQQLESRRYEYVPLVRVHAWTAIPKHLPLFESLLVFENYPTIRLDEGLSTPLAIGEARFVERTNYPLTLVVAPGSQLTLRMMHDSQSYDAGGIVQMLAHLRSVLGAIAAAPTQQLGEVSLLTDTERQQVLVGWNGTTRRRPERCIHEQFELQAARAPDAVALVCEDSALTYGQLNQRANRLARLLRRSGVRPESRVGICAERSLDLVVGILAIIKAGGAYLPLDPAYPAERLALMLEDAQVSVLLTQERLRATIPAGPAQAISLDQSDAVDLDEEEAGNPLNAVAPDNLAYIIYTSGSTGRPKGVLVSHANVMRLFAATQEWFDFVETDVWTLFHSCAFDFSVWELWGALLYGGRLVVVPYWASRAPEAFYELLDTRQVTVLNQTPSAFRQLIRAEETADLDRCLRLRLVIFGGEALELQALKPWLDRHGDRSPRLVNMYGITEVTVHVTYRPVSLADLSEGAKSPIGHRIPDLQVYLLDQQLQLAPIGALAELAIGGAGLARGYLNRPDLTAERFIPNPFAGGMGDGGWVLGAESSNTRHPTPNTRLYRTGDLGFYRPDGDIEYVRRTDQQIKLRGYRIELGEIEAALVRHPVVREAAVVAREDLPGDTRLVAYLVLRTEGRGLSGADSSALSPQSSVLSELRAFLKQRLPDYMVPAAFVVLDALPLTAQGKVNRRALPLPDHSDAVLGEAFIPPRDTLELRLLRIWEEVLATRPIGVRDNFLDLGGHSLLAVSLLARIQQLTDRRLPLATIFQAPTVEQQAALLRQTAPPVWSALVPLQPSGSAPPFFCVHPVGGNVISFAQLARHLGDDQPFYGLQAPGLDGAMVPFTQIEPMAAYYVEELRRIQPEGPYLLGGWSMGGVVAFEMAQQLRRQGEIVALLALLDTPSKRLDEHRAHPAPLIDLFAQDLGRFNKEIPLLVPLLDPPDVERQLRSILDRVQRENLLPMSVGLAELRQLYGVFEANMQARDSYMPQVYADRVTLFRASEALGNRPIGVDLGWRALAPDGLTIQIVPGDHYTMLQEPQVQILAQRLKTCIDESLNPRAHDGAAGTSAGAAITLLSRAGDQKIDTLLREIVGRYEAAFPSRIRACYLSGSYAMGGPVPDSDVDMIMVFTGSMIDDEEQEKAREVYQSCSLLTPLDLSIDILAEAELISHANVFKTVTVKMASTLIYGEDVRDTIIMPPSDLYTRTMMNAAFLHAAQTPLIPFPFLSRLRRVGGAVVFPLDYPDPAGEFYGYDLYRGADGSVCSGTKALVKSTRDMARAIVARRAGPYTTVTSEYARTYREHVGDEWAGLIEDIYETCKQQWRYQIPTDAHDRQKLRELCRQVLGFENHFLAIYRDHLLEELESAEEESIILAVKKLGESVYPDDQIIARLQKLAAGSNAGIREAIEKTKKRILKVRSQRGIPDADSVSGVGASPDPSRWTAYAGAYRGDSVLGPITASVHVGEDVLWVYVPALAAKIPCSPFDDRCFDSVYGFIEFQETEDSAPQAVTVDVTGGGTLTLRKVMLSAHVQQRPAD